MAQPFPGIGTVMTYNVNEGTDFLQVVGAPNLPQFLLDVGQILTQVQGTNPPERMQAVARQILDVQPELLSLQEVDQWYTGTFNPNAGTCGTMTLAVRHVAGTAQCLGRTGRALRSCRASHSKFISARTRTDSALQLTFALP